MKIAALLWIWILATSLAAAENSGSDSTKSHIDKVVVEMPSGFHFRVAGYVAAVEKGYYADAGLNVVLQEGDPERIASERVLKDQAQFGISGSEIVLNRMRGDPVVVLAVIFQHSPHALMVRYDSDILTLRDLIGRKVMIEMNQRDAELMAMFRKEGIDMSGITFLRNSGDIGDLILGKTDAMGTYAALGPAQLQSRGIPTSLIHPSHYGIDFYGDCLFTTQEQVRFHPERVEAFRRATLRGWKFAMENPDELIDLLMTRFEGDKRGLRRSHLRHEAEAMRQLTDINLVELGYMNIERWERIAKTYADLGMAARPYTLEGFVYSPPGKTDYSWVRWIVAIVAVATMLILGIWLWNLRLRTEISRRTSELTGKNDELMREGVERRKAEESRAELEEQLRQSHKMEAIGQLAGGVAHDFNNLLTPIIGYAELTLMETPPSSRQHSNLSHILKSADHAKMLTTQLLAFSRKQVLEMKVLNLSEEIAHFEKILRRIIREDIEITTRLDPDVGRIKGDPTQFQQILMNLVVNAQDAMPGGGNLTIETGNVTLDEAFVLTHPDVVPGHYVSLTVSDTGDGMDENTRNRIFEPFFTTKERDKGTGLGLATVYGIVKQHGGSIWVQSEPGQGSTFKIFIPRTDNSVDEVEDEKHGSALVHNGETLVVAEDDEMVRKLTVEILALHGYNVLESVTPEDALQIARDYAGEIHMLVTDVVMPKMNGIELYRNMLAIRPGIKVLYLSGYTDNILATHGMSASNIKLLQKPFSVQSLTSKVKEVLEEEKPGKAQADDAAEEVGQGSRKSPESSI